MGQYRYPKVEVFVRSTSGETADLGGRDIIERVEVDGEAWPVKSVNWKAENDRGGAAITLEVRGQLRITEVDPSEPRLVGLSPHEG